MGKSATGKDTLYQRLLTRFPELKTVVLYTTRPKRDGEEDGVTYHFTSKEQLQQFEQQKKVIEVRTYETVEGPWSYATIEDGQVNLENHSYLIIGTLESYEKLKAFYGKEQLEPLYIEVEDGLRLERALIRERTQKNPKYLELCRRYLADDEDFSKEKLEKSEIKRAFQNESMEACLTEIANVIHLYR